MIEIEPMNLKNYQQIARISKENLEESWSEKTILRQLENPNDHTFLAYYNGIPAGFLSLWIVADEGEINNIAVDKNFRKKGVASALFERIFSEFPPARIQPPVLPNTLAVTNTSKQE